MLLQQQPDLPRNLRLLMRLHEIVPAWASGCFVCLAFLGIMVLLVGTEVKLAVKRAWSLWDVRCSAGLLQDEVTAEAGVRMLRDALVRTPDEPAVIRAFARLTEQAGMHRHARFFYQHLERRGAATSEDQLRHVAVVARLHDHLGAWVMLEAINRQEGSSPDMWRVEAEAAALRGDHRAARSILQRLLAAAPGDTGAEFGLGNAEAQSANAQTHHEGIRRMLDLLEKTQRDYDPTQRHACLWTLAEMQIDDPAQRQRFARLVAAVSWQQLERLVLLRFLEGSVDQADPDRSRQRADLSKLLAEHERVGRLERLSVARMLQRHGEHGLVLGWIPPSLALKDQGLCVARLDSLLAMRQWLSARNLVQEVPSPLPMPLQSIFHAQIELLAQGSRSGTAEKLLRKALGDACRAGQQPPLVAVGRLASQFGKHQIAFEAYAQAMNPAFPEAQFLVGALVDEARFGGGKATQVLRCLEAREAIESWNHEWRRQIAYFRLLCGERLELVDVSLDQGIVAASPFITALNAYRLGDHSLMRQWLMEASASFSNLGVERALLTALEPKESGGNDRGLSMATPGLFEEERRLIHRVGF